MFAETMKMELTVAMETVVSEATVQSHNSVTEMHILR